MVIVEGVLVIVVACIGFRIKISERGYFPGIDDDALQLVLFRSQEIPYVQQKIIPCLHPVPACRRYVEDGVLDAGICGLDWIKENGAQVVEVCELHYSKTTNQPAKWVIAVDENSSVQTIHDLSDGIIASELVNTTKKSAIEL